VTVQDLPHLNATLNALSALLVATGYVFIRRKNIRAHRACMLSAVAVSTAFLVSYLIYHFQVGSVRFDGPPTIRTIYLGILLTHTILAAAVPFLVGTTVYRALKGRIERHRAIARWTLPIWIYVSITGVIVYLMLYHR